MAWLGGRRLLSRMAFQSSAHECSRRLGGFSCRCLLWQAVKSTCSQLGFCSAPAKEGRSVVWITVQDTEADFTPTLRPQSYKSQTARKDQHPSLAASSHSFSPHLLPVISGLSSISRSAETTVLSRVKTICSRNSGPKCFSTQAYWKARNGW